MLDPPQPKQPAPLSWIARGGVALLTLAVVLLLLEGALRIVSLVEDELAAGRARPIEGYWAIADEELGYRLNPDFGDHNELGLRDDPIGPKGDRLRVLVLGDSLGYYGPTPAETWVGRLEVLLRASLGCAAVDVVNACVKGYTTHQELSYLERDGLDLEPDVVVLGFVLNDLHEYLHGFRVRDGRILDDRPYAVTTRPGDDAVSHLLRWIQWRLPRLHAQEGRVFAFERRLGARPAWDEDAWETVRAQLRRLVDLGRQHGFRAAVLVFPVDEQYRVEDLERDREHVLKPQRELRAVCEELGLPLLDLYEHLDPLAHLAPDGLHLSGPGRVRVAERVARFLADAGLLECSR